VLAVVVISLYAAYLAAQVEDVIAPVEITVPSGGATSPLGTGQRAADFTLTDLDGRPVSLSDYAGRPVWINVWASWCAPCRAEMPDIDTVYREIRAADAQRGASGQQTDGQGLVLLMVSLGEDPAPVRRYLNTTRYDLPVLVDPTFAFTERYRITGLPTHFFIDRSGTIRDLAIGGLKTNAMRARLAKIT
jgi:thiol-disulfide isomerase/thioredoxin